MKQILNRFFIITFMILAPFAAQGEYVFLNDGSIIEGKISSDATNYILLKNSKGKTLQVERKKILRVIYAELNMEKLYVQKRNGESFVAFLVDEDRDDYVFRSDLYKPVEFKVKKSLVLFMSEKNPSALKGEPFNDRVKLSWLPPYGQIRVYKIYMKEKKGDEYRVVGTTKKTEITISGLKSQTPYFYIVRAVDDTDYETSPSNEIKVITRSIPPDRPSVDAEKDNAGSWLVSWSEASDHDGKVAGYRIYIENDGKYSLFKETKSLNAVIPGDVVFDSLHVRSLDSNGDESEAVDYREDWRFLISPLYAISTGKMAEYAGNGYGVNIDISRRDLFFYDSEFGISAGYLNIEGKKKIGSGNSNVTSFVIYPAALFAAYRIPIVVNKFNHYDVISLFPKVSAGLMTMEVDYLLYDSSGAVEEKKSALIIEPFIKAGLFTEFGLSRNFFLVAGLEYLYMIDKIQGLGMLNISASAGFRF